MARYPHGVPNPAIMASHIDGAAAATVRACLIDRAVVGPEDQPGGGDFGTDTEELTASLTLFEGRWRVANEVVEHHWDDDGGCVR
ncbi:MAG: hypothetical protein JWM89_3780 [Acidimicrobiales bacterium]|nr:hypothetical protein [Acidimicrobiales bacterium]